MAGSGPGRPRSQRARRAILDAAMAIATAEGYRAVTVKGVAEAAGVGRQTIYRWWPTVAYVLLEALFERGEEVAAPSDTGDAWRDLRSFLTETFALANEAGTILMGLVADSEHDPRLSAKVRAGLGRRQEMLGDVLRRGQARGQVGYGCSAELIVDMIFGAMWYRLVGGHGAIDTRLAGELTDAAVRLLGEGV